MSFYFTPAGSKIKILKEAPMIFACENRGAFFYIKLDETKLLVSIILRLKRPFLLHPDILGLAVVEFLQFDADFGEVEAGYLLVEVFGQGEDDVVVLVCVGPQLDLSQGLVGERVGHHERGVACGAAQVDEAAFGQQQYVLAVDGVFIDLGLDDDFGVAVVVG
jgi:hypothetical protein